MKASYNFLRELLGELALSPDALAARLTALGLAVDAVTEFGSAAKSCKVARVSSLRPHPQRANLRLVSVELGA